MFTNDFSIEEFEKHSSNWQTYLSDEEKVVIRYYTGDEYEEINQSLILKSKDLSFEIDDEIKRKIKILDQSLSKSSFNKNIIVKRIENIPSDKIINILKMIKEKQVLLYPNFISTSIKNNYELYIGANFDRNIFRIIIEAIIPKGTKCGYLDKKLSIFPDEREILILRNCALKILNVNLERKDKNIIEIKGIFLQGRLE